MFAGNRTVIPPRRKTKLLGSIKIILGAIKKLVRCFLAFQFVVEEHI
jgi:hypothetical protein